ncbi:hypothetical protein FGIG_02467 [Fasciola gigantica]|uniref:Uncharacterized protein n=1 Tax=Fasciola gigantica TaxID=46835 RepID=A0A504Y999_FASGI|nr:hypothetical protein FGIG_02467 [Fasciola gigantica]
MSLSAAIDWFVGKLICLERITVSLYILDKLTGTTRCIFFVVEPFHSLRSAVKVLFTYNLAAISQLLLYIVDNSYLAFHSDVTVLHHHRTFLLSPHLNYVSRQFPNSTFFGHKRMIFCEFCLL